MSNDLEMSIHRSKKEIRFLLDQPVSFREARRPVVGDNRIKDAELLTRDELVEWEQKRLAYYEDMLGQLV